MNFSRFDVVIIVTMSFALIAMSFTFPALGFGSGTAEGDVPNFSVQNDKFDIAGDRPQAPNSPTTGTLTWDGSEGSDFSDNQVWLDGNLDNGTELTLVDKNQTHMKVNIISYDSSAISDQANFTFNNSDVKEVLKAGGYDIIFTVENYTDHGGGELDAVVDYQITDQPNTDGGFLGRVPIVGQIFSATESLAAIVAWGVAVVRWFMVSSAETSLNMLSMILDVTTFVFEVLAWQTHVYADVIGSTSPWAALILTLPGLVLSLELAKLVMIGISLLPTT